MSIESKLQKWNDADAREVNLRLVHLEDRLFSSYEPAQLPEQKFWFRLEKWLNNVSSDDQEKTLFKSIPLLFYIGPEEFRELYRAAYNGPIARWLIDEKGFMFDDASVNMEQALREAVSTTWFCPISDSMRINAFYHVNNIPGGFDHRPDWLSLEKFGDEEEIREYCKRNSIERLVLLEDFVGGGSQMTAAVKFAAKFSDVISILVAPLVICPKGVETCMQLKEKLDVKFSPILALSKETFMTEEAIPGENILMTHLRDLANETYRFVSGGHSPGGEKPYHALGWDKVGGMVIMHTNTPDNTLPLYHSKSKNWDPLFPRHSRV